MDAVLENPVLVEVCKKFASEINDVKAQIETLTEEIQALKETKQEQSEPVQEKKGNLAVEKEEYTTDDVALDKIFYCGQK